MFYFNFGVLYIIVCRTKIAAEAYQCRDVVRKPRSSDMRRDRKSPQQKCFTQWLKRKCGANNFIFGLSVVCYEHSVSSVGGCGSQVHRINV